MTSLVPGSLTYARRFLKMLFIPFKILGDEGERREAGAGRGGVGAAFKNPAGLFGILGSRYWWILSGGGFGGSLAGVSWALRLFSRCPCHSFEIGS